MINERPMPEHGSDKECQRVSVAQAASEIGLSVQAVRIRMRKGNLNIGKVVKIGPNKHDYLIYRSLLDRYIKTGDGDRTDNANFTVIARVFNDGRTIVRVRPVKPEDEAGYKETSVCSEWIDLFELEEDAYRFAEQYKKD